MHDRIWRRTHVGFQGTIECSASSAVVDSWNCIKGRDMGACLGKWTLPLGTLGGPRGNVGREESACVCTNE